MTRSMSSFDKAMALFGALVAQDGVFESDAMSVQLGVPESTLYRHLNALHSAGLICRSKRGRYLPNPVFLKKLEGFTPHAVLSEIVRPILEQLSVALETTTHFGILENDMVTYLAKAVFEGEEVFTREKGQLEAYCSAIGKVLLSHMTVDERQASSLKSRLTLARAILLPTRRPVSVGRDVMPPCSGRREPLTST